MLIFILYAFLFTGLIRYNAFFGLFRDASISKRTLALLFAGKLLAVPAFLAVYTRIYGGIEQFDTGKFYNDALVIFDFGKKDPVFLLRILFGLQNDLPGSYDYEQALKYTMNWDNGTIKDYLYNDNRIVIRTHVLLNFLAFRAYAAHALFNCFLSFTGIFFIYKTFKEKFAGREIAMLLILCFLPALWFYTGALLKEGLLMFVLGCTLYQLKKACDGQLRLWGLIGLVCLLYLSLLLKPYLLVFSATCFFLYFLIGKWLDARYRIIAFLSVVCLAVIAANLSSLGLKKKSLLTAAIEHRHRFTGVSRGGIFLSDSVNFIRLTNDTLQVERAPGTRNRYTIRENVTYMYWKTADQQDTLYCTANKDTVKTYELMYIITPGQSNIEIPYSNPFQIMAACFYYTLFYPSVFSAKNALQLLAALENLLVAVALIIILWGFVRSRQEKYLPFVFVLFALSLCLLIGFTAPNSGAIFRYRSPAVVFLLLAALYFLQEPLPKPGRRKMPRH